MDNFSPGCATTLGNLCALQGFFLTLDSEQVCRYRGRINDNAKFEQVKVHDLNVAIDALLAGKEVPVTSTKAFGCTIKWKQDKSKKKSS